MTTPGVSTEKIVLEMYSTRTIIRRCSSQIRLAATTRTKSATVFRNKYISGHQSNLGSVNAGLKNITATEDIFLAFVVVQQVMVELSGVATEKRKGF
jgi:hypothetical protein